MILRPENYLSQYAGKVYKGEAKAFAKQYLGLLDEELRMNRIKRAILLTSGGFDSLAAMYMLKRTTWAANAELICLRVDLGHEYNEAEETAYRDLLSTYGSNGEEELYFPILKSDKLRTRHTVKQAGIPARNLALASIAAMYEPDAIMMANVADDNVYDAIPDCTYEFRNKMSDICSLVLGHKVEVFSPVQLLTKSDLMSIVVNGLGGSELLRSSSCYHPVHYACGECQACFRRMVACINSNVQDEHEYQKDPMPEYEASFLYGRKPALTVQEVQDAFYTYYRGHNPCRIRQTSRS